MWKDLTLNQKSDLMKLYVQNGITDLNQIINHYNKFENGGSEDDILLEPEEETYTVPMLPEVNITAAAPSINTKKGVALAKKMARDIYEGRMDFNQVPVDYRNYVYGEVKGAIPYAQKYHPGARAVGLAAAGIMGGAGLQALAGSGALTATGKAAETVVDKAVRPAVETVGKVFTPSQWTNIYGQQVFNPTVGTWLDWGVNSAFMGEGAMGLYDQYQNETLSLTNPDTYLNGLMLLPGVNGVIKLGGEGMTALANTEAVQKGVRKLRNTKRWVQKQLTAKKRITDLIEKQSELADKAFDQEGKFRDFQYAMLDKLQEQERQLRQIAKEKGQYRGTPINVEKASVEDIQRVINKRAATTEKVRGYDISIDADKTIRLTPTTANSSSQPLGTNGAYDIVQFRTGTTKTGEVTGGNVINKPGNVTYELKGRQYGKPTVDSSIVLDGMPEVEGELREVLKDNIKYVQEEIPGFKPFGSSVGVSEDAMSHITHDIDGYMTQEEFEVFSKGHSVSPKVKNETYVYKVKNGQFGEQGDIDINIVNVEKDGTGNDRAVELYRQFFPEEYHKQVADLATKGKSDVNIKILDANGKPMSSAKLMEAFDPLQKTIMDSMEINFNSAVKSKHRFRFFNYLMGNNAEGVHQALEKTAKMELGENGKLLPKLKLGSTNEQIEVLTSVGYPKSIAEGIVAKGQEHVQNALDYWYLSDCTYSRAVNAGDINEVGGTFEKLLRNLSVWNPEAGGGTASGGGLNSTVKGMSNHSRAVEGVLQPKLRGVKDGMDAKDAVNRIKWQFLSEGSLSAEDINKIATVDPQLANILHEGDNINTLLRKISEAGTPQEWHDRFNAIAQVLDTNGFIGRGYNSGIYFGLRDLDPVADAIGVNAGDVAIGSQRFQRIPSLSQRIGSINDLSDVPNIDAYLYQATTKQRYNDKIKDLQNIADHYHHKAMQKEGMTQEMYRRKHDLEAKLYNNRLRTAELSKIGSGALLTAGLGFLANEIYSGYNKQKTISRLDEYLPEDVAQEFYNKRNELWDEKRELYHNDDLSEKEYKKAHKKIMKKERALEDEYVKLVDEYKRARRKEKSFGGNLFAMGGPEGTDNPFEYARNQYTTNTMSADFARELNDSVNARNFGFAPEVLAHGIGTESGYNVSAKNPNSTAKGIFQLTRTSLRQMYGDKQGDAIYNQYLNNMRSQTNQIHDAMTYIQKIDDNIKSNRQNMSAGRFKANLLAPNSAMSAKISDAVWQHSLTKDQRNALTKGKSTYNDLADFYNKGYDIFLEGYNAQKPVIKNKKKK